MPIKDLAKMAAYQNKWMQDRRRAWIVAQGGKCVRCGSEHELEVDHVDPGKKLTHRVWSMKDEDRLAELAKCQVLCKSCHFQKTCEDNGWRRHGRERMWRYEKCQCAECCAERKRVYKNEVRRRKGLPPIPRVA